MDMYTVQYNSITSLNFNSFAGVYIMQNTMVGGGGGMDAGEKNKKLWKKGGKLHEKREKSP